MGIPENGLPQRTNCEQIGSVRLMCLRCEIAVRMAIGLRFANLILFKTERAADVWTTACNSLPDICSV
jgi:hypothetical protein